MFSLNIIFIPFFRIYWARLRFLSFSLFLWLFCLQTILTFIFSFISLFSVSSILYIFSMNQILYFNSCIIVHMSMNLLLLLFFALLCGSFSNFLKKMLNHFQNFFLHHLSKSLFKFQNYGTLVAQRQTLLQAL